MRLLPPGSDSRRPRLRARGPARGDGGLSRRAAGRAGAVRVPRAPRLAAHDDGDLPVRPRGASGRNGAPGGRLRPGRAVRDHRLRVARARARPARVRRRPPRALARAGDLRDRQRTLRRRPAARSSGGVRARRPRRPRRGSASRVTRSAAWSRRRTRSAAGSRRSRSRRASPTRATTTRCLGLGMPSLSLAGRLDCSAKLEDVRAGFEKLPSPSALVVLDGVTHYQFTASEQPDSRSRLHAGDRPRDRPCADPRGERGVLRRGALGRRRRRRPARGNPRRGGDDPMKALLLAAWLLPLSAFAQVPLLASGRARARRPRGLSARRHRCVRRGRGRRLLVRGARRAAVGIGALGARGAQLAARRRAVLGLGAARRSAPVHARRPLRISGSGRTPA